MALCRCPMGVYEYGSIISWLVQELLYTECKLERVNEI
jgi:hypothetical protein